VCQLRVEREDVQGRCLLCGGVGVHLAVDKVLSRDEGSQNSRVGGGRVLSVSQH
jgi:hypothetical protein